MLCISFNDLKVNGERREINKGTNDKGYFLFDVSHSIKFTKAANGELVSDRDWKREREYDRGKDLQTNKDDRVWVTGSAKVEKNGTTIKLLMQSRMNILVSPLSLSQKCLFRFLLKSFAILLAYIF